MNMMMYNVMSNKEKCMYRCLYLNIFNKDMYSKCVQDIIAYKELMKATDKKNTAFMNGYNCERYKHESA